MKKTSKVTLARVNAEQPATLCQVLFARLLGRCQLAAPKHKSSGTYTDAETIVEYRFVTNAYHLKAKEIAVIYKERWQIELCFKWIK